MCSLVTGGQTCSLPICPADPVREHERALAFERGPGLAAEHACEFGLGGERMEERLDEAEPGPAGRIDQFQRRDMDVVGAHLAVADHPVAGELKAGNAKVD